MDISRWFSPRVGGYIERMHTHSTRIIGSTGFIMKPGLISNVMRSLLRREEDEDYQEKTTENTKEG